MHAGSAHPVGTLVSVNVGMPKDVPWQGKTVFTGVFKDSVSGPRRVRKLNVDGDGQGDLAGHGGERGPCSSTRWTPTATGKESSAETTSSTDSLARTSRSKDRATTRSALVTVTGSARASSKSRNLASPATGSASA